MTHWKVDLLEKTLMLGKTEGRRRRDDRSSMPEVGPHLGKDQRELWRRMSNREKSPQGDWNTLEMWDKLRLEKD